jgi:hypothetical protein
VENKSPKLPDPRESLGKYQDFPSPKIRFSSHKIRFFFNSFPLSSMAFCFLQRLYDFPQRLFDFPQRLFTFQEIRENLFTAASIQKITIQALNFPPLAP